MKCMPPPVEDEDLQTAIDPEIGGEKQLYVSMDPWQFIADIQQPAEASGVLTLNPLFSLSDNGPLDLQLLSYNGARSDEDIVVTFGVTFDDGTNGQATATFAVPARSGNQSPTVPAGMAVDVNGAGNKATNQIASVNSIVSVVGGDVGNKFKLVAMPDDSTFSRVGFVTTAGLKLPVSTSVAIPDGLDGSAAIKRGRSEAGTLQAKAGYIDYMNGLARVNGLFVTAKIETWKDERVLTERTYIDRWKAMANPDRGDGNTVVEADTQGNFQTFAVFTAP